jgi:hypothetical protein
VAVLSFIFWPDLNSLSVRLVIATAILFGHVAAVAARALRDLQELMATTSAPDRTLGAVPH